MSSPTYTMNLQMLLQAINNNSNLQQTRASVASLNSPTFGNAAYAYQILGVNPGLRPITDNITHIIGMYVRNLDTSGTVIMSIQLFVGGVVQQVFQLPSGAFCLYFDPTDGSVGPLGLNISTVSGNADAEILYWVA